MVTTEPEISLPELTKFVSQLSHDLRNHLNAISLQIAFLTEIAPNEEMKQEVQRLRKMTDDFGTDLQKLSASLKPPRLQTMSYAAKEFVEDLESKLANVEPELAPMVDWRNSLGAEAFEIDPQLLQQAFLELFANAARHDRTEDRLTFEGRPSGDAIELRLCEPKTKFEGSTENWGERPFQSIGHSHYGLGLFWARGIFQAHHGTLQAQFDPAASVLVTTVCLPRLVS
jgi:K+-sensing histidine kinase KdpD